MTNKFEKLQKIYEGKAKILFATSDPKLLIQHFKDDATAFNAQKKAVIPGKGKLNNLISEYIMLELAKNGIKTHFVEKLNEREQLVKKVKIIPLEIIIRNITAGSLSARLGVDEGIVLESPIFEICYKNDALQDPLLNDDHAVEVLRVINRKQLELLRNNAFKINKLLQNIFKNININLVDFKIEFGIDDDGEIILADEISPDGCRLWDCNTSEKMDKDRFRRNLGGLVEAYQEIALRFNINFNSK
jgi:phosphoribosylaminoimidazole-succinocarboxamide synthase